VTPRLRAAGVLVAAAALVPLRPARAEDPPAKGSPADAKAAYDALVARYKAKDWDAVLAAAPDFLRDHPGWRHAGTARYVLAVAQFERRLWDDAVASAERYAKDHAGGTYAERLELLRARALFKARRREPAKAAFDAFLAAHPGSPRARDAREWRARIDPQDAKVVHGSVVLDYEGKYAKDPRFTARAEEVARLVPLTLRGLAGSLRLPSVPKPRLRVRFRDLEDRQGRAHVETREELHGDVVVQSVVFHTEPLVLDLVDVPRTLAHELVHVLHRDRLQEDYYGVPEWVREGMALYAAEQGPDRVREILATEVTHAGDLVARLVDGLSTDADHDFTDYAEDVLAFEWVAKAKGAPAARALVVDLLSTPDWKGAFERASGMPFPRFEEAARAAARERIEAEVPALDEYRAARALLDRGETEAAKRSLERIRAARAHPARAAAIRDLATIHLRAGRLDEAQGALDALEGEPLATAFRDDAAIRRVTLAATRGKGDEAKALAQAALRDFSWKDAKWKASVRRAAGLPEEAEAPTDAEDEGAGRGD
jgi:outer membrane protein assembly factor BamD (BamD/ComL family)